MTASIFETFYRHWIWIGIPVLLLSLASLVCVIRGVIATVRSAHLCRVPLAGRQEVDFAAAGTVVLSTEGPRFSTRFARLEFGLQGVEGDAVPGRRVLFRARTSGISTVRTESRTFDLPRPGRYVLTTSGLGAPQANDSRHAVVFMRPHLLQSMVYVLGIVASAAVFIVSLVFWLLRLGAATD
jgi:hypothetical protein